MICVQQHECKTVENMTKSKLKKCFNLGIYQRTLKKTKKQAEDEAVVTDVAVLNVSSVRKKEHDKLEKNQELRGEQGELWSV